LRKKTASRTGNHIVQGNVAQHVACSTLLMAAQRKRRSHQDFQPPAQSVDDASRDHTGVGRPDLLTPDLQIGDRGQHAVGVVIVQPQAQIAVGAKQAALLAGRVTMIGVEPAVVFLFADRTDAALPREQDTKTCFQATARLYCWIYTEGRHARNVAKASVEELP
jgi:hypothetical protein